jgi:hypothetical protein
MGGYGGIGRAASHCRVPPAVTNYRYCRVISNMPQRRLYTARRQEYTGTAGVSLPVRVVILRATVRRHRLSWHSVHPGPCQCGTID